MTVLLLRCFQGIAVLALFGQLNVSAVAADTSHPIKVLNPKRLGESQLTAERTPLGVAEDYKPWVVQCKNGELLLVAFVATHEKPFNERAVFWRSTDDGKTWGAREDQSDVFGREFAMTCLTDGPCR